MASALDRAPACGPSHSRSNPSLRPRLLKLCPITPLPLQAPPTPPAPYPLLCAELAIRHQVHLIGEVHGPCQFDEQVNAEAVAALRHRVTCCGV